MPTYSALVKENMENTPSILSHISSILSHRFSALSFYLPLYWEDLRLRRGQWNLWKWEKHFLRWETPDIVHHLPQTTSQHPQIQVRTNQLRTAEFGSSGKSRWHFIVFSACSLRLLLPTTWPIPHSRARPQGLMLRGRTRKEGIEVPTPLSLKSVLKNECPPKRDCFCKIKIKTG